MLYKFVQGDERELLGIFEKAVVGGSLKFTSAMKFNDPFEFKFNSIAPTRDAYDAWHEIHDPERTVEELNNGWAAFSGSAADWNTTFMPRQNLLNGLYVLCLSQRWDSHLMWAHYACNHEGYAIIYQQEIVAALSSRCGVEAAGPVTYSKIVPDLRWFHGPRDEMVGPLLSTKSAEWSYEREFRLILSGEPGQVALYQEINPNLIAGVILGTRTSEAVIGRALSIRQERPDFIIKMVSSKPRSYALDTYDVKDNTRRYGHVL